MKGFDHLLAKSRRADEPLHPSLLLSGHLSDVYAAALRLLEATSNDQLFALGLDPAAYGERFRRIVLLAAAVHDLGKANDHFQEMIHGRRDIRVNPQGLRHEWVTVLMLSQLREWLLPVVDGSTDDFAIVEWVVSGHHPAHNHPSPPKGPPDQGGSGPEIYFLADHKDFSDILSWVKKQFDLASEAPSITPLKHNLVGGETVFGVLRRWLRAGQQTWERWGILDRRLVAAAKNALIAADVAGSALPKAKPSDPNRWTWITESLMKKPERGDLQTVVNHRLNGNKPRPFQIEVASSQHRVTLVKAGCGSGKTLSAYMWAAKNWPTRRLYFCYPTTGTATEGFKDYLFEPDSELGGIGAKLFHSRRDVDFEIILTTGKDTESSEADAVARLESLEAWSTPIVACTVDTVLGLLQNNKRGLYAWPALAQSAFIFDEIHAYDDRLFESLLRFLRDLPNLPVLLMTASLPAVREEALQKVVGNLSPSIPGPDDLETRPRYRKATMTDNNPLALVAETLKTGGKVLWVCNTVGRVLETAERACAFCPLLYHSRFKYEDRVKRHRAVIEAFRSEGRPALAICSQVAEMSLDLSADLLVTDLAPVPALIQRLGRLNRRAKDSDRTKPFFVVEPEGPKPYLPYTAADLAAARVWLEKLPNDGISQQHLVEAWKHPDSQPPSPGESAWLDGGPETKVKELREASPGITVLMEEDRQRVRDRPKDLARLVLPMPPPPRSLDWRAWPKERGVPIAPTGTINYCPMRGAQWCE
jgi:CRISPR-associated endonuclease/helicase Cas3